MCGALIAARDARFCAACGAAVVPSPETAEPPSSPSTGADVEEPRVEQQYAWAIVLALLLRLIIVSTLGPRWTEWTAAVTFAWMTCNTVLVFADIYANGAEMTVGRLLAGVFLVPIWLWMRGSVLKTTRAPLWAYLGVAGVGLLAIVASGK
jgi:hypothetical protein